MLSKINDQVFEKLDNGNAKVVDLRDQILKMVLVAISDKRQMTSSPQWCKILF